MEKRNINAFHLPFTQTSHSDIHMDEFHCFTQRGVGSEGMTVCEKDGQTDSPQLLEHLDPLTALGRLSLEHVAVVGFGGRGELRQVCGRQRQHRL